MAKIVRMRLAAEKLGVGISTLYDWLNPQSPRHNPSLPKRIRLGQNTSGMLEEELDQWLTAHRQEGRSG